MAGKGTRGTGGAGERLGDGTAHRKAYRAPRAVTLPADLARARRIAKTVAAIAERP